MIGIGQFTAGFCGVVIGGWAFVSRKSIGQKMDHFIVSRPKLAKRLGGWDEDTKKAPTAATAGAKNYLANQVYPSIVSRRLGIRKAMKRNG